ncbi:BTB/POZ and MATH domain-containing protein 3-like [Carex rostrata]
MEMVTSTRMFKITGYSLDKHMGKGKFLESTIFDVGNNYWSIQYYPSGCLAAEDDDISIFICLKSKLECVKAQYSFTILDQNGCASLLSNTREITHFGNDTEWGFLSFAKRDVFESYIKDDCFVIKCMVSVFKVFPVEPLAQFAVLPGNIQQKFDHLFLENENEADVQGRIYCSTGGPF